MLVILGSLIMISSKLNLNLSNLSIGENIFLRIPIELYFGWISVATIANIAAWLAKLKWSFLLNDIQWTMVMICTGGTLNLLMLIKRKMTVFVLVGIWALVAIGLRHRFEIESLFWLANIWVIVLAISIVIHKVLINKNQTITTL
jgi:hypothetical protein